MGARWALAARSSWHKICRQLQLQLTSTPSSARCSTLPPGASTSRLHHIIAEPPLMRRLTSLPASGAVWLPSLRQDDWDKRVQG